VPPVHPGLLRPDQLLVVPLIAEAIATLLAAGRTASAAGAAESAVDHFRNANNLAGDSVTTEMSQLLAEALLNAGRLKEVPTVLGPLLEQPGIPAPEHATALRLAGTTYGLAGNFDLATSKLLTAADEFDSTGPVQAAAAVYMGLSLCMLFQGPFQAAPFADRAASLRARGLPGEALASDIDAVAGCAAVLSGDPAGWDLLTSARASAEKATTKQRVAGVDLTQRVGLPYMLCATFLEHSDEALRVLRTSMPQVEHRGMPIAVAFYAIYGAELLSRHGDLDGAEALMRRAGAVSELVFPVAPYLSLLRAQLAFRRGDDARALNLAKRTQRDFGALQGRLPLFWARLWVLRARLAIGAVNPVEAVGLCRDVEVLMTSNGYLEPCVARWHDIAIEANIMVGDRDEAERLIGQLEDIQQRLPCQWPRAVAHTGRGLLAETAGDFDQARVNFDLALVFANPGLPLATGELMSTAARYFYRRGEVARARTLFEELARMGERCGAGRLAWLASHDLASNE
jgi:tetratricopeptide (TPR) repeat protein